jgi:hypothetical protein
MVVRTILKEYTNRICRVRLIQAACNNWQIPKREVPAILYKQKLDT